MPERPVEFAWGMITWSAIAEPIMESGFRAHIGPIALMSQ